MKSLDALGPGVGLSLEDYLLGIYDMTGELMKFAITAMATSGSLPSINGANTTGPADVVAPAGTQRNVLTDMRNLRAALESLDTCTGPFAKDVDKKAEVMRASVEKVEKALYGLTVRGAERPKGWLPDTSDTARAVEVEG
jgi:predicted translin family RNA/ssDNA-binding protein